MKKTAIILIIALALALATFALSLTGCDDKGDTHTHEWEWKVTTPATPTADGLETETCKTCGATNGTRPIAKLVLETKTFPITFKDGALVFTVEYKAYPTDAEPAYLTYLQTRLGVFVNSTDDEDAIDSTNRLMNKGSNFKIKVEYDDTSYSGLLWNTTSQTFTIHNDWISTAAGTNLTLTMIETAFNNVVIQ